METRTQNRITRSKLNWAPTHSPNKHGPIARAAQRAELSLFNNISGLRIESAKSAFTWLFNATTATAEGAARSGFYVWKVPGSLDAYYAISKVD